MSIKNIFKQLKRVFVSSLTFTVALILPLVLSPTLLACEDPITGAQYDQQLTLSRSNSNGITHVKVKAPSNIDGNQLTGIYLISNTQDTANIMSVRLALWENAGFAHAHFSMAESLLSGTNVEAWYPKGGCRMVSAQPTI